METPTTPTIRAAVSARIAAHIEEHGVVPLARRASLLLLAGLLSAALVNLDVTLGGANALLAWHDFALGKVAWTFAAVLNAHRLPQLGRHLAGILARWVPAGETSEGETPDTLEGIPTAELLDHLFTEKALRIDAWKKFGAKQYQVERIVKNLRRVEVLVKGPNNASVLNPEYARQDVASILRGKAKADQLEPLFRRDARGLTSRPSAAEIRERVEPAPLPRAPGFTLSTLSALAPVS
jgi:hypothetical protein